MLLLFLLLLPSFAYARVQCHPGESLLALQSITMGMTTRVATSEEIAWVRAEDDFLWFRRTLFASLPTESKVGEPRVTMSAYEEACVSSETEVAWSHEMSTPGILRFFLGVLILKSSSFLAHQSLVYYTALTATGVVFALVVAAYCASKMMGGDLSIGTYFWLLSFHVVALYANFLFRDLLMDHLELVAGYAILSGLASLAAAHFYVKRGIPPALMDIVDATFLFCGATLCFSGIPSPRLGALVAITLLLGTTIPRFLFSREEEEETVDLSKRRRLQSREEYEREGFSYTIQSLKDLSDALNAEARHRQALLLDTSAR